MGDKNFPLPSFTDYCKMAKFCAKPKNASKAAVTRQSDLRVSFKNTHATVKRLKGMSLDRAKTFLKNVLSRKECVPFFRFNSGVGQCAQAKQWKNNQGRWPAKSARYALDLLTNLENNANFKGLDTEKMTVTHTSIHRAPKMRRRTYRAHGRINPYMSTPCHVQIMAEEKPDEVKIPGIKKQDKRKNYTTFKKTKSKPHKRTYSAKKRAEAQAKLAGASDEETKKAAAKASAPKKSTKKVAKK